MRILRCFVFFSLIALGAWGCLTAESSFTRIAPGMWRAALQLEPFSIPVHDKDSIFVLHDAIREGVLPFTFEVKYVDEEQFFIEIINGPERIRCDSIRYGRDRTQARDTFNVYFPEYQTWIHAEVRGAFMKGEWVVPSRGNYRIPFTARAGQNFRFTSLKETPASDLSGQWAVLFGTDTPEPDKAIGEFQQEENYLTGTFRTESGDYRFLEGTVQGRKFWLSTFDGVHAYLFAGTISTDSLRGEFRSGKHHRSLWTAWRDPNFRLGNPDSITTVLSSSPEINFDLVTPEGKRIQYPGPMFDNKIKIFTIMGTWCPNCRDEQAFLTEYLKNNPEIAKQLAIVGFSFEKHAATADANAHLLNYKKRMGIPYDLVYAGKASAAEAEKFFPALNQVSAFPTMIIVDKDNRIRRIHTGFDGPATSKYAEFQQHFSELMETLQSETASN